MKTAREMLGARTARMNPLYDIYRYEYDRQFAGRYTPVVINAIRTAKALREKNNVMLYIAGPLTGVSEETKQRYADTSNLISTQSTTSRRMFGYAPHLHGTDPVKHPDVTPEEVRDIDYLFAVASADAHINFLDPLAHGNAIEAGWAEAAEIPSLYVVSTETKLSRLVLGMNNIIDVIRYDDFKGEALPQIGQFLESL